MQQLIYVTFTLNEGCTQTVDFSNLQKGTNLIRLCNDWKHDLKASDYKIEKESIVD